MLFFTKTMIFILGASIGSFLNVLIDRLPNSQSIAGRSHCDFCKKKLTWLDLVPILSFIFLKGKSRCCNRKLSFQYPLVEVITGIVFVLIFNQEAQLNSVILWGIVSSLIVIFFSDLKYHLISDYILLALLGFSFFYHFFNNITIQQYSNYFISGLLVAFPIFLIYHISHERAMGLGDVYLTAIMGFLLGWKAGFIALYIAFVTGAIIGLMLIMFHKKKIKGKIPFGPFLVIGTIIMLFWGNRIFDIINKLYGF